ncbi:MAG: inovirus Gp2 family protein [Epsilonproteobacteria bacterium]|nr:inovirus Gp2 family protein [Campylobacterota bacterium]
MTKDKQDRKTKYFKDYLALDNEQLKINAGVGKGVYLEILTRIINQLGIAYSIHKRLLVLRFDLHLNHYTSNNEVISKFLKRTKQWISRNYNIKDIGYAWVREIERAKTQHYHLVLFLDGDKIRYPNKLTKHIKETWSDNGYMPTIKNPYYFIDKHNHKEMRAEAINRISYLAKTRGKRYRDPQTKDYGASRLKTRVINEYKF